MKAIVCTEYGNADVLKMQDITQPTPSNDEVLIKIKATSINISDWYLLTGKPLMLRAESGIRKPKLSVLGADVAGVVEAVGPNASKFKIGDAVFGDLSWASRGGFAEYVAVSEKHLAAKPENVSFEDASAVPISAVTALQALRDRAEIQTGQKVLINGASGGVGSYALQLAVYFGAEVTAVVSTRKVEQARQLGAAHVVDYTQEDFTQQNDRYDLVLGVNGNRSPFEYRKVLAPNGMCVIVGGTMRQIFQGMLLGPIATMGRNMKIGSFMVKESTDDLAFVADLIAENRIISLIDRCYPLDQGIDAMRYFGEGHANGKVIISMQPSATA